jgi:hypothetical protein
VKQAETMPVNCATAEGDLRMLRSEKTNVAEQIAEIKQKCGVNQHAARRMANAAGAVGAG